MFLTIIAVLLAGGWQFQERTDEMTDATYTTAVLYSDSGEETMHLMCSDGLGVLVVRWDTVIGGGGDVDVTYRLDGAPAEEFPWRVSESDPYTIALPPNRDVGPVLRRMAAADKMLIRVSPVRDTSSSARFHTAGLAELLPKFKSCNFNGEEK